MAKFKNLANFSDSKSLKGTRKHFSHKVYVLKKIKNQSNWYLKHLGENLTEAFIETIAQEFFRLILPYHPKTRIAIGEDAKSCYVLSKEICNFNANFFLVPENNKYIINGQVTGLAAAQILALFLNEIDFKPCNVGVAGKKVIKIDGGLCFARLNSNLNTLLEGKNMDITRADIEALPALIHYEASNWLNLIKWNPEGEKAQKKSPTAAYRTINQMPNFKQELYQTILRVILLPDELIHFFAQSYAPDGIPRNCTNRISNMLTVLANTLITRKNQLEQVAYQIPAFNDYRLSLSAHEEILAYLEQLKKFKTISSSILLSNPKGKSALNEKAIFEKHITAYSTIKKISQKFDLYKTRLDNPLNIESLLLSSQEDRLDIIERLKKIKPVFTQYLNLPKISYFNELYSELPNIIAKFNSFPGCLLIQEINISLPQLAPPSKTNQHKGAYFSPFFTNKKPPTSETYSPNKKTISHFYAG